MKSSKVIVNKSEHNIKKNQLHGWARQPCIPLPKIPKIHIKKKMELKIEGTIIIIGILYLNKRKNIEKGPTNDITTNMNGTNLNSIIHQLPHG